VLSSTRTGGGTTSSSVSDSATTGSTAAAVGCRERGGGGGTTSSTLGLTSRVTTAEAAGATGVGDDDGADDDEEEDEDEDVNGTGVVVIDADAKGAVVTDAVTNAGVAGVAAAAVPDEDDEDDEDDDDDDDDDGVVCAMPNRGDTAAATPVFPPAVTPAGVTGTTGCDTSLGEAAFRPLDAGATAVDPAGRRATPNSLDVAATLPAEEVEAALDDADTDTDAVDAVDGVGPA